MNLGAEAERKAMRGIITTLKRDGFLDTLSAALIRRKITEHVAAVSKREGGLGRK
jgi:hypothetical protein